MVGQLDASAYVYALASKDLAKAADLQPWHGDVLLTQARAIDLRTPCVKSGNGLPFVSRARAHSHTWPTQGHCSHV